MHYVIQQDLARAHQAALLRNAEQHRLARLARPERMQRRRISSFLARVRLGRPQRRPAPAV
jgi:hypothetical protein